MDSLSVFGLAQKKRKIFFWIRIWMFPKDAPQDKPFWHATIWISSFYEITFWIFLDLHPWFIVNPLLCPHPLPSNKAPALDKHSY